jgi:hypothetical protein
MGVLGPPWKVSKEFNDITLVGYQFYSVFSTENESRVDTYLRFQIRLPQGGPWGSGGPLVGGGGRGVSIFNDISYYSGLDMLQNCPALDTLWADSADDAHRTSPPVSSLPCYC